MTKPMSTANDETAWCPGCGNFMILSAVKKALASLDIAPHETLFVSGIGQAAKTPHYLSTNVFNGLHGRSLPVATGAKLANPRLTVVAESGDGCHYGEGGNHFLAAIRRNVDITLLVHDNRVYGLTKGQASPTSPEGFVTKAQPDGAFSRPFRPVAIAVAMNATFVARAFSGMESHLARIIAEGIRHKGFSLIDILQPCVSFNRINTFAWYKQRCYEIPETHDPTDWDKAMRLAQERGDHIPVGVIYKEERASFDEHFSVLRDGPLFRQSTKRDTLASVLNAYA